jgi:RAP domain
VWALATLQTNAPKILAAVDERADLFLRHGTAQNISNCAWAFASLGFEATKFFNALDRDPRTFLGKELNLQSVANLCFAIAIVGRVVESQTLLLQLWDRAIQLYAEDAMFTDEQCWQMEQTAIFARAWGVELSPCPVAMAKSMEQAMAAKNAKDNALSRGSKEVSKILTDIGFDHECEVPPDSNIVGGMMAIDFACTRRKVAIEYDGEWHFLRALGSGELTFQQDGSTKAKRRLLEQLGWTVINLDFREYMTACDMSKETEWIRAELNNSGVLLP